MAGPFGGEEVPEPTAEEQLIYFVTLLGIERLGDVFALMKPEEIHAVRQAVAKPLPPGRVGVVRSAVTKRMRSIGQSAAPRPSRELRVHNGWIV